MSQLPFHDTNINARKNSKYLVVTE
jgi:hypothetical protein